MLNLNKNKNFDKWFNINNICNNIYYLIYYKQIPIKKVIKEIWFTEEEFSYLKYGELEQINKKIDEDLLYNLSKVLDVDMKMFFIKFQNYLLLEILHYYLTKFNNEIDINKLFSLLYLINEEHLKQKIPFMKLNFTNFNWYIIDFDLLDIKDLLIFKKDKITIKWMKTKFKDYLIMENNNKSFKILDKIFKEFWNKNSEELNKIIIESLKKKNKILL